MAALFESVDQHGSLRRLPCHLLRLVVIGGIKTVEGIPDFRGDRSFLLFKYLPETFLVGAGTIIDHHRIDTLPDGNRQALRVETVRRHEFYKIAEIILDIDVEILRQKCAVQVKENRFHTVLL